MMDSRVDSTRVVGEAIAGAAQPAPGVAADEHRHDLRPPLRRPERRGDRRHRRATSPDVPAYWEYSVDIATALGGRPSWRRRRPGHAQGRAARGDGDEPGPRRRLRRAAAAGAAGPRRRRRGRRAVRVLDPRPRLRPRRRVPARPRGPRRAGQPGRARARCPSASSCATLRRAWGRGSGCRQRGGWRRSAPWRCARDTELLLKSRRVVPGRLLDAGFAFEHAAVAGGRRGPRPAGASALSRRCVGRRRRAVPSAAQSFVAGDSATHTTPRLPSWSAITVSDGDSLSSTTVPPAVTAAEIRSSAASRAT